MFFPVIIEALGQAGLNSHDDADVRVVIEKPFGTSLAEAEELNRRVLSVFDERQVFRIDHYLGKETVQNVLAFRFANGLFEPLWNRNYIDHVQITAAEDIGIGIARGLLRQRRRAARPRAEPHAPAPVPALHGAAGDVHGQRGPRREGQGPPRDHAADGRGGAGDVGPRAVHRRRGRRRGGRGLPRGGGRPGRLHDGDVRRAAPRGRQLALGGRARCTCARASAWRARSPRSPSPSSRSRTSASSRTAPRTCGRTSSS